MKQFSVTSIFFLLLISSFGQDKVPVFTGGMEGYKSYRIPAIIKGANDVLLAFSEGRVGGAGDFGNVDIVMKRSTDGGKTWGPLQVVANNDTLQAGNPAPVYVIPNSTAKTKKKKVKAPRAKIFLFYNTGNKSEDDIRKGNGVREVWYKTSSDNGLTWGAPVNITLSVHKPLQKSFDSRYNFAEDWRWVANLPGHAIQIKEGKYKGRIFVAANHSVGKPQNKFLDLAAFGFFSDDNGKTFHIGGNVHIPGSSESTAAELTNNKLMMSSRNQKYDVRARIVSISSDGGASWDTTFYDETLIDPICEGSLLSLGKVDNSYTLAFCNSSDKVIRDNLTLRISKDDGKTWTKGTVVERSPEGKNNNYTGYSDLVQLPDSTIGVLYERNNYKEIMFTSIDWKK